MFWRFSTSILNISCFSALKILKELWKQGLQCVSGQQPTIGTVCQNHYTQGPLSLSACVCPLCACVGHLSLTHKFTHAYTLNSKIDSKKRLKCERGTWNLKWPCEVTPLPPPPSSYQKSKWNNPCRTCMVVSQCCLSTFFSRRNWLFSFLQLCSAISFLCL